MIQIIWRFVAVMFDGPKVYVMDIIIWKKISSREQFIHRIPLDIYDETWNYSWLRQRRNEFIKFYFFFHHLFDGLTIVHRP